MTTINYDDKHVFCRDDRMFGHGNGDYGQYGYHAPDQWKSFWFLKDG
jgi:hypothetical protein